MPPRRGGWCFREAEEDGENLPDSLSVEAEALAEFAQGQALHDAEPEYLSVAVVGGAAVF